jgi:uncharacterized membrane protein
MKPTKDLNKKLQSKLVIVKIPIVLVTIALILLVLLTPFFVMLFNVGFYYDEYQKLGTIQKIGKENAFLATYNMFSFFKCRNADFVKCEDALKVEYNYQGSRFQFTEDEIKHLEDVKSVFIGLTWVFYFVLLIFIFYSCFLGVSFFRRKRKKEFFHLYSKMLLKSGLYLLIAIGIFLIIMLNFDQAFITFHKLFFPQGNYAFPADSFIKTLFPDQFFSDFVRKMFSGMIITTGIFIVVGGIGSIFLREKKKKIN